MSESFLNINLNIAGRPYKLKVSHDEEALVRKTAKAINDKITSLQQQYFSQDKQDFLAMIALENMVKLQKQTSDAGLSTEWEVRLNDLDSLLNSILKSK
jgi:cell division protein ZapA (FtsZ GTPase activity inhibitor)